MLDVQAKAKSASVGARSVLSNLDDAFAAAGLTTSLPQTPSKKRKADEHQRTTPAKRRDAREFPEGSRDCSPQQNDHEVPCTPRRAADQALDMERLFPNSFLESPKGKLDNNAQVQAENRKIGPPLTEALKILGLKSPNDFFPDLDIKLMKHQIIGTSWMLQQELDPVNRGGILR
ncbi:hypothetical protein K439DRAFT_702825 [Ramaria rubella]|nr:hypothetical protein K439DRAFT_702825 [Ramaria rubella]